MVSATDSYSRILGLPDRHHLHDMLTDALNWSSDYTESSEHCVHVPWPLWLSHAVEHDSSTVMGLTCIPEYPLRTSTATFST
jgi:hypothetical protein